MLSIYSAFVERFQAANLLQVKIRGYMQEWGEICTTADIIRVINSDEFEKFIANPAPDYRFATDYNSPFGTWFRGQTNAEWNLIPAIFRKQDQVFLEETSMFHHFQLRMPEYHQTHRGTFDWLCLMQHYDLPTRLLDWTESALVALFFAVEDRETRHTDRESQAGRLYVLNARRLNEYTTHKDKEYRRNVCTPDSFDTVARAQLARTRTLKRWQEHMTPLIKTGSYSRLFSKRFRYEPIDKEWLASPVAVIPSRLNGRMVFQSSAFTIHGGKRIRRRMETQGDFLPDPQGLEEINDKLETAKQFLISFRIPFDRKEHIRKELLILGIHLGSLFPELDKQASHVKERWRFDIPDKA